MKTIILILLLIPTICFSLTPKQEKSNDIKRQSAISIYISQALPAFKVEYPQFANWKETRIRQYIYNTPETETIMTRLEAIANAIRINTKDIRPNALKIFRDKTKTPAIRLNALMLLLRFR